MKKQAYLWGTIVCITITSTFVWLLGGADIFRYRRLNMGPITAFTSQQEVHSETQIEGWFVGDSFDVLSFENEMNRFCYQGKNVGFIGCAQDAVDIAEYLWSEVYDYNLEVKKPFVVSFDENNRVWLVYGSLRPNRFGGVPYVLMNMEGNVLALWHTR